MFDRFHTWVEWFRALTWWQSLALSVGLFLITFVASLVVVAYILMRIPEDYFVGDMDHHSFKDRHPWIRMILLIGKNLLGLLLVLLGVILSLPGVPGQGVLTILIGIMLLNFPGKRRLERKLVSRPAVLNTINRLRARYGREPLRVE